MFCTFFLDEWGGAWLFVWGFTRMICVPNMFCTFFLDEKGTQKIKTYSFGLQL
jgi:hypothetical protein